MNYVIKELCLNITTNLSGFNQTTACVTSHTGVADDDGIATDVHNVFMVFSSTPKCSATQVNSFQLQPMPTMRCDKYIQRVYFKVVKNYSFEIIFLRVLKNGMLEYVRLRLQQKHKKNHHKMFLFSFSFQTVRPLMEYKTINRVSRISPKYCSKNRRRGGVPQLNRT